MQWWRSCVYLYESTMVRGAWLTSVAGNSVLQAPSIFMRNSSSLFPRAFERHFTLNLRRRVSAQSWKQLGSTCDPSLQISIVNVSEGIDESVVVRVGQKCCCTINAPPSLMSKERLGLLEPFSKALVASTTLTEIRGSPRVETKLNNGNYYVSSSDSRTFLLHSMYRESFTLDPCPYASQIVQVHLPILSSYHNRCGKMPRIFGFRTVVNEEVAAAIRSYDPMEIRTTYPTDAFFSQIVKNTSLGKTMTRGLEALFGCQTTAADLNWHVKQLEIQSGDFAMGKFFNVLFTINDDRCADKARQYSTKSCLYSMCEQWSLQRLRCCLHFLPEVFPQ